LPRRALAAVLLLLALPAAAADPRADYLMHCSGCHMPDGSGHTPVVPTLHGVTGRMAATAAGRDYLIRVPGVAQAPVGDATLAAILNWMLIEFSSDTLPENFEPFSADEVGASRSTLLPDPLRLRAKLFPDY